VKSMRTTEADDERFEKIEAGAKADPDAQPATDEQLARMRRIPLAKHARFRSGLTQAAFSKRYGIPIGTLRDWEQGRFEPDASAAAYLKAIAANPFSVACQDGPEKHVEAERIEELVGQLRPGEALFIPDANGKMAVVDGDRVGCDIAFRFKVDDHEGCLLIKR